MDSILHLGRWRLLIQTATLWQVIHVFSPLPRSYGCLPEISSVLADHFTYSPVYLTQPSYVVLTNPSFSPQGLTNGVIQARSRDDMRTVVNGMYMSMWLWTRVSKLLTASSTSVLLKTLYQVSLSSSMNNASFWCFLQSLMRTIWRTGFSFVPTGMMTAVWSVFIDMQCRVYFPKKSGLFKKATPLVWKSTRKFHPESSDTAYFRQAFKKGLN